MLANPYSGAAKTSAGGSAAGNIVTKSSIQLTGTQRSAIYFKRHKESECRVALLRQLRATLENRIRDVKHKTVDKACLPHAFRSGQLSLRGFES